MTYSQKPFSDSRIVALIGDPVHHSLSPVMQNQAFSSAGMGWFYHSVKISPGKVASAFQSAIMLNYAGMNVTMPHKEEAAKCCERLCGNASILGTVNTVCFDNGTISGYNTDVGGFSDAISYAGFNVKLPVLILGAGATARSVASALHISRRSSLIIASRNIDTASRMVIELKKLFPDIDIRVSDFSKLSSEVICSGLVVNTTPCGMDGYPGLPIQISELQAEGGPDLFDMVYGTTNKPWLNAVSERGGNAWDGRLHLVFQGARSFRIWTGISPQIPSMMKAVGITVDSFGLERVAESAILD